MCSVENNHASASLELTEEEIMNGYPTKHIFCKADTAGKIHGFVLRLREVLSPSLSTTLCSGTLEILTSDGMADVFKSCQFSVTSEYFL